MKKVSIIIPTLNGEKYLQVTLEKIFRQRIEPEPEVICVDSGSTDNTLPILRSFPVKILNIPREEFNHGSARNIGAKEASGDALCFLVQDATPLNEEWLSSLVKALDADDKIAGVFSRQIPRTGCSPFIRERLRYGANASDHPVRFQISNPTQYRDLAPAEKRAAVAFDNVSSIVRREAWEPFPFPPLPFGEDLFWAKTVLEKGFIILYEPSSCIIHSHNRSIWAEFKRIYADSRNQRALFGVDYIPKLRTCLYLTWKDMRRYQRATWSELRIGLRLLFYSFSSLPFAAAENTAKYLGGKGEGWAKGKGWYRTLDRIFQRGL